MPPHQAKRQAEPAEPAGGTDDKPERQKVTVKLDGKEFPLYPDEISNRDELDLWKETGLTVNEILSTDPWPRPLIAAAMWLSLRTQGLRPSYDDVAELITPDVELSKVLGEAGPKA